MERILGLDPGTNSIGIAVRDTSVGGDFCDQLVYFNSCIFKSGVGKDKSGEFSFAAQRTGFRSQRSRLRALRNRRYSTLKVLIEGRFCPLTMDELARWYHYDKNAEIHREYPSGSVSFEQWIRLDFNSDGIPDYRSPFHLRAELVSRRLDLEDLVERYKLGRAIYHFVFHRGFKSSKGETLKEQEESGEALDVTALKKSEEKRSGRLVEYMTAKSLPTVGCACASLLDEGIRVRGSEYQPVRAMLKEELRKILAFQGFVETDNLWQTVLGEKKGVGTVFYKRPLKSQRSNVGHCKLEPDRRRCPQSHPEFEMFNAWTLINNIRIRESEADEWKEIPIGTKRELFDAKFMRLRDSFDFGEICDWLKKKNGAGVVYSKKAGTINFDDRKTVLCCPVCARLKRMLGDDWQTWKFESTVCRAVYRKDGTATEHTVSYNYEDLWHICFSSDESDDVLAFAREKLNWTEEKAMELVRMWFGMRDGYANLSLKAIRKINLFLREGVIYPYAVLMAKVPDIVGLDVFDCRREEIFNALKSVYDDIRQTRLLFEIVNVLISDYKSLDVKEQFAFRNTGYRLDDDDMRDVRLCCERVIGENTWLSKYSGAEREAIVASVAGYYQKFFESGKRDYYRIPRAEIQFEEWLKNEFPERSRSVRLYHPSMIDVYAPAKDLKSSGAGSNVRQLGSPSIDSIRNPMVMRVMYTMRKELNGLLLQGVIDEHTSVMVEMARELNDANMRWAIEMYQRKRENENKEYRGKLEEIYPGRNITEEDVKRYRFWEEQNGICLYTKERISAARLLDGASYDIEHTLPRSRSFDDSQVNQTLCSSYYNRQKKCNRMPCELENYDEILESIRPWIDKVEKVKDELKFWKLKSRKASDKGYKDKCIRQRHLLELELAYWQGKVSRFTMTDIPQGFRNSQLNDTRIISKYLYHYLRTVFEHVEVINGQETAALRKMLGAQSVYETKDRSKHSHHAVDASILTAVTVAAQRNRMLELHYRIEEEEKLGHDVSHLRYKLQKEKMNCGISNVSAINRTIERGILVNHVSKDQTLTPSRRRVRIADGSGSGKRVVVSSDCIRGSLHESSYYGAIKQAVRKADGGLLRENDGKIVIGEQVYYVIRRELRYKVSSVDKGFKDWEELKSSMVDKSLFDKMVGQFPAGTSLKDACQQGIYVFDRKGNKVNRIRHVRCYTSNRNPVVVKNQQYKSDHPWKQKVYAASGDIYAASLYQSGDGLKREYRIWTKFQICKNRQNGLGYVPDAILSHDGKRLSFVRSLFVGQSVLLYEQRPEELYGLDVESLSKRLYVIRGFESSGAVVLQHHNCSKDDKVLGKGESIKDFSRIPEKIRCGLKSLKFLVKGFDFDISSSKFRTEPVVFRHD